MTTIYKQLKCSVKGHENQVLTYLCLNEQCISADHLLCLKCAINHGHSKNFVLIDDILQKDELKIDNWPQDDIGKRIRNLLYWNSKGQAEEIIENLFEELQSQIINKLNEIKQQLVEAFQVQGQVTQPNSLPAQTPPSALVPRLELPPPLW